MSAVHGQSNPSDINTLPKPEHSTALQPIMFGFFCAYSLYMDCIIGIGYIIWHRYRNGLLKWAVSMRERKLLRIDTIMSSEYAWHRRGNRGMGWIRGGLSPHRSEKQKIIYLHEGKEREHERKMTILRENLYTCIYSVLGRSTLIYILRIYIRVWLSHTQYTRVKDFVRSMGLISRGQADILDIE